MLAVCRQWLYLDPLRTRMPEVTLIGHIVVPPSDLEAVAAELRSHIELTRNELGCLEFDVVRDTGDPAIFHVSERFISPEAFSLHQERVRSSPWGSLTTHVERHYKITGIDD